MHDLRWILDNLDEAKSRLALRGNIQGLEPILALAEERRVAVTTHNDLRAEQNRLSKDFGAQKNAPPEEQAATRDRLKALSAEVKALDVRAKEIEERLSAELLLMPNIPHASVPPGASADDNVVVRTWGTPTEHAFDPFEHDALGDRLGILDFEAAARLSGAGFVVYRGLGARLERALWSFFLDTHVEQHGYEEVLTPFIVRRESMIGTGQLPKFSEEAYRTDPDDMYLIPTAEVPVTNLYRGAMLDGADLPKKMVAFSPCFRREAGSHGREVRGLTRVHQFQKVELVQLTTPEHSLAAHEELTRQAEAVLQKLGLPYRTVELCGGDLGLNAAKCYDIEVWLPVQKRWREISSCSNFLEFQARRADIRYRPEPGAKPRHVHTLNGSGVAVGRAIMAILEVYQTADGGLTIPEVLRPYMRVDRIAPR